jgi:NAD(P)H dehydrogenase (quinone)
MYHWGAIIAVPGFTDPSVFEAGGNPYGTTVTVDENGKMAENVMAAVKHQAKRTVTAARRLKKGRE